MFVFCPIGIGAFGLGIPITQRSFASADNYYNKKGAALQEIADQLSTLGLISNKHLFLFGAYLPMQNGECEPAIFLWIRK